MTAPPHGVPNHKRIAYLQFIQGPPDPEGIALDLLRPLTLHSPMSGQLHNKTVEITAEESDSEEDVQEETIAEAEVVEDTVDDVTEEESLEETEVTDGIDNNEDLTETDIGDESNAGS